MKNKKKIKRLLIIPAKGKSNRIKNKNSKKFLGKPIINYSIVAAKKSRLFDKIHVSTDSKKIMNLCEKLKIDVPFYRKKSLSKDNVGLFDVYKNSVTYFSKNGEMFDEIWCLLPCSPLITDKDLNNLSYKIKKKEIKLPCISVSKFPAQIEWSYSMSKSKKLYPVFKKKHIISSKRFTQKFYDVGVLSVFTFSNFMKNNSITINKKFYGFELPWYKSTDIDYLEDWQEAEVKFRLNKI